LALSTGNGADLADRLGLPVDPLCHQVAQGLATPPIRNRVYVTLEKPETTGASWMACGACWRRLLKR
jgi:hypothetical protein